MRVGFVVGDFPDPTETFIARKLDYLLEHGHEVFVFRNWPWPPKVFSGMRRHPTEDLWRKGQKRIRAVSYILGRALSNKHTLGSVPRIYSRTFQTRYANSLRTDRLARFLSIARRELDILHIHFAHNLLPLLGIKRALGLPVVVSLLGSDVTSSQEIPFPHYLQLVPGESNALIASSEYLAAEFRRRAGSSAAIHILPPEVPHSQFECNRQYHRSPCRLLTVARLHWKKGHIYALHAAHELKTRGVDFTYDMVGDGFDRPHVEKAIEDLGLRGVVTLHGVKVPQEIPDFLRRADIFVLSSVSEAAGTVLVEAQASGLPVVATRVEGIPEFVQDGSTGRLVHSRDPKALADAIEDIIRSPELRRRLGTSGKEFAGRFDTELVGARLVDIYQEVLQRHGKGICRNDDGLHTHGWNPDGAAMHKDAFSLHSEHE